MTTDGIVDIRTVDRIMVIGHPGAGKSTLSVELGRILDLPVIHLDREYWQPGWVELTDSEWAERMKTVANRQQWIMDGSYDGTLDIRLPRADVVILLDFSRWLCMRRVIGRCLKNLGRVRADMADDCPEKIDFGFYRFVWNYHRDRMPMVKEKIERYLTNDRLIRLDNPAGTVRFLDEFRSG